MDALSTRAKTLVCAIERLKECGVLEMDAKRLQVCIAGSSPRFEGSLDESTKHIFGPCVKECGLDTLKLVFVGFEFFDAEEKELGDGLVVEGRCCGLEELDIGDFDFLLAYHSGFWGYSSWTTALRWYFMELKRPVFVSTAYTLKECEADEDHIVALGAKLLWESEERRGEKIPVGTCPTTGDTLYDNLAWLAFQ